jgi:outer membrane protein assembly factor BamB
MLPPNCTVKKLGKLVILTTTAILSIVSIANALTFADDSARKIFICPKELSRLATIVTTRHDLNLCGKQGGDATLLAVRIRRTQRVVTMPIISSKDHVYIAKSPKGTYYNLNTQTNLLIIQKKNGKVFQEKVVASN